MRIIYTHRKGELAEARRQRQRDPKYRDRQALDRLAAEMRALAKTYSGKPELRKTLPPGKKEDPSS